MRPVIFLVYAGRMRWRTKTGDEMEAQLGQDNTKDITAQAWRTALDPEGEWIPAVLRSADRRLSEVREQVPDAGGLVIATDQTAARAYAEILRGITGEEPAVVLSDEAEASSRIEAFATSTTRWMVAVRMVSEGVDVPRLAVGVYATSASTPLFFAQAIGRFVRARRRGETASVFLPNVPQLLALAGELERQRDHALDRDSDGDDWNAEEDLMDAAEREDKASDALTAGVHLPGARLARPLRPRALRRQGVRAARGARHAGGGGVPGASRPARARARPRAAACSGRPARAGIAVRARRGEAAAGGGCREHAVPAPLHRSLKEQRQLLNSLVGLYARQTGEPHGAVHAELRRVCGGPAVSHATVAQLQARIDVLRSRVRS